LNIFFKFLKTCLVIADKKFHKAKQNGRKRKEKKRKEDRRKERKRTAMGQNPIQEYCVSV